MTDQALMNLSQLSTEARELLLQRLRERQGQGAGEQADFDAVILGGGVAGLALALQLTALSPAPRVAVVERSTFPVEETTHKVGESTVEIAAHYLRDILGMEEHLVDRQLKKFGLRMFFSAGDNADIGARVEVGSSVFPPLATYQIDRGRLENELARRCRDAGVVLVDGQSVVDVSDAQDGPYRVAVAGSPRSVMTARWVVDATGRARYLRRRAGSADLPTRHEANAAWLRVADWIDVNEWSRAPGWADRTPDGDRSLSTNHLMGRGYWVWLIRLASGGTSVGIVADPAQHPFSTFNTLPRAVSWLEENEPQLAGAVSARLDKVLDFKVMGKYSYGCEKVYDGTRRWALTGESGLFLDPLYSPGLDLIAISNTLVTDLIHRDLRGEEVDSVAQMHDKLFREIADIWMGIYRDQYLMFGDARVMASKVIWDTGFYWAVFGSLFFGEQLPRVAMSRPLGETLRMLTQLSNRMQQFFREWHGLPAAPLQPGFMDLYSPLDFMVDFHRGMAQAPKNDAFDTGFAASAKRLRHLAGELMSTVIDHHSNTFDDDAVIATVQAWRRDPLVAELVREFRQASASGRPDRRWVHMGATIESGAPPGQHPEATPTQAAMQPQAVAGARAGQNEQENSDELVATA